jgi:hypothetical protein
MTDDLLGICHRSHTKLSSMEIKMFYPNNIRHPSSVFRPPSPVLRHPTPLLQQHLPQITRIWKRYVVV